MKQHGFTIDDINKEWLTEAHRRILSNKSTITNEAKNAEFTKGQRTETFAINRNMLS